MRVVVSVQAKSGSSRGLVHYIAHSKTDPTQGEPQTREIFSDYSNRTSVKKANEFLKNGISNKRVSNTELHHLVISFKAEDFNLLGENEKERQNSLKQITSYALERMKETVGAERLNWAAGIHRNTNNPHVHVAVQKTFFDKNEEKKILTKIPRELLPHYEKSGEEGEKVFVSGLMIDAANQKLEEIIKDKQKIKRDKAKESKPAKTQKFSPEKAKENLETSAQKLTANQNQQAGEIQSEREVLARAILAKFYLEKTRENLKSLTDHGDKRRFKIFDKLTGKHRRLSLFDLERRAEKEASRQIRKEKITDPARRESFRKDFVRGELEKNSESVGRIKTILHNLIRKENQTLARQETDYKQVKPLAEKIRQKCARGGQKLPVPTLSREELQMLQTAALEKGNIRAAHYFERVRKELAIERGGPTRTDKELERLKAKQFVSNLRVRLSEKRAQDFADNRRVFSFEIGGGKWSLSKIDSLIENKTVTDQKLRGKIGKVLDKIGLSKSEKTQQKLEEIKASVLEKIDEKSEELSKEISRERSISKTLNEFYRGDSSSENKENLKPEFTARELGEIESFAFELKDAAAYRENWQRQKELIESFAAKDGKNFLAEDKQKIIAVRAIAHEVMCRIELNRAKGEFKNFQKHKQIQKFEITSKKTGEIKLASLNEVELHLHGSILNQTLDFFLESSDKRQTRRELQKIVKEKEAALKENYKAAGRLEKFAAGEAKEFKTKSFFGAEKYLFEPVFTPKELVAIELRIKQTENKSEARNLQKILDSAAVQSGGKNLSKILSGFIPDKENSEQNKNPSKDRQADYPNSNKSTAQETNKVIFGAEINQPEQNLKIKSENPVKAR